MMEGALHSLDTNSDCDSARAPSTTGYLTGYELHFDRRVVSTAISTTSAGRVKIHSSTDGVGMGSVAWEWLWLRRIHVALRASWA